MNSRSRSLIFVFVFVLGTSVLANGQTRPKDSRSRLSTSGSNHPEIAASERGRTVSLAATGSRKKTVPTGMWGGRHISMDVGRKRTSIEYDCARATIDQEIVLDSRGRFNVSGKQFPERGGPVRPDAVAAYAVRFSGQVHGETMTLTVRNSQTQESIGTFTLVHGNEPRLMKCK